MALRWCVDWALSELKKMGSELFVLGLDSTVWFICNVANYLVIFARLAVKGVGGLGGVLFCSNLVERLMGEIAKRVKHYVDVLE